MFQRLTSVSEEERKLCMTMLGKLNLASSQVSERLQIVGGLVQDAIDERVADDAAGRSILGKVQNTISKAHTAPGRSRANSATRSVAPSVVGDAEETASGMNEDESDCTTVPQWESTASPNTPAPSPRRNIQGKRSSKVVKQPEPEPEPMDVEMSGMNDDISTITEGVEQTTIVVDEESERVPQRVSSTRKDRPRWRPEELEAESRSSSASLDATESPAQTPHIRPAEEVGASATTTTATQRVRPARRNVRASRRQQLLSSAMSEDGQGEE